MKVFFFPLVGVSPAVPLLKLLPTTEARAQHKRPISFVLSFMPSINFEHHTQFFTSTIFGWKHLLKVDSYRQIIIDSLLFLKKEGSIAVNAFVIMRNHIHLIWQALNESTLSAIQASFMKYTAQQIKRLIIKNSPGMLVGFKVNKYDRDYQIWKREPLNIELISQSLFIQKQEYIHYNPVSAGFYSVPEEYFCSSANFYFDETDNFGMLTHYSGN